MEKVCGDEQQIYMVYDYRKIIKCTGEWNIKRTVMLSEKSSRKISALSFGLFIGVMGIHTYNLEVYNLGGNSDTILSVVESFLYRFESGTCVSFFFMISGFLFFRNFDFSMLLPKYRSRGRSILIPYIIWNTVYYLYYVCMTRIPWVASIMSGGKKMPVGIIAYVQYIWSGYYTLWFLRELIWLILLTPLWYLILKRRKYYLPEVILVLMILISLDIIHVPEISLNMYYISGAYWGLNYKSIMGRWQNSQKSILTVVSAVGLPVIIVYGEKYIGRLWYNYLLFLLIWTAMDLLPFKSNVPWWIKCTFFYYCAHDLVLEAVEKAILLLGGKSVFMAWIDYIFAPAITLMILISAAWILRKWMPFIWKVLSGGRK